jgi:hypothetical protein
VPTNGDNSQSFMKISSHSKVEMGDTQATGYSRKPTSFPLQEGKCAKN